MSIRSLIAPVLLVTAFSGGVAWLLLAEPPEVKSNAETNPAPAEQQTLSSAVKANSAEQAPDDETAAASQAPLPDAIRDVSPEGVSAPEVTGSLTRIEPSERYLELKNPPVDPIPDGPLELVRVQVPDAGHILSERLLIQLAHITPLAADETCVSRLGGSWPCGVRARTFLRGLVRQFKITCEKIEDLEPQKILATCQRGSIDLSARLVRYGWADPTDDAPQEYQILAEEARAKKIGKWQSEWLAELPEPAWSTQDVPDLPDLSDLEPEIVEWSLRTTPETEAGPVDSIPGPSDLQNLNISPN
ncbi:thermonuclease family protein [Roseibium denhamense]|uniref:TNase-like domain-containing protein n=1 Tax=Roseibium denhamense TaxID=76305 RepID=A0ABY1P5S6_9HYPH|nr:thermonuclease family protein [Roseibium denhamense]MTI07257.1 thermonuclease family protein [Roseibium denhamense]SMP26230.1 hypothetical protein SAMN06265374_2693 [Roseibium denhamense]